MKTDGGYTKETFAEELSERIKQVLFERFGATATMEIRATTRTNVVRLGIVASFDGSNIAPAAYVDDAYQKFCSGDQTISQIAEEMGEGLFLTFQRGIDLPELTPEEAKKHITLTLVNSAMNRKMLDQTPHMEILGGELSAIPRWYLSEGASFIVSNELASRMMLTPDEVLRIGQEHINAQNFEAKPLNQMMVELLGGEFADVVPVRDGPQIIVLTSENRIQGANALLSEEALKHVHEMIGDYIVLPSSIHEVLCVSRSDDLTPDELRSMVREINCTLVAPKERLSDNIMMYDGRKLELLADGFRMGEPEYDCPDVAMDAVGFSM